MKEATSAGGIIVRKSRQSEHQVLLLKYQNFDGYSFPKGHVEDGESIAGAALREVEEETGKSGFKVIRKLGVVTRGATETDGTKVRKDIHLFLMLGENLVNAGEPEETCEWHNLDAARELLSFDQEREFFDSVMEDIRNLKI